MSLLLALDASAAAISVAISRDGTLLAHDRQELARGHAERLPPALAATMRASGHGFADLSAIAVTVGPGSFTGIRVGLAAARGLGFALGIPVLGVTTLEAVAHGIDAATRAGRPVLVLIDSKRADVFAQRFAATLEPVDEPRALSLDAARSLAAAPMLVTGDAASLIVPASGLLIRPALPDARSVARLAEERRAGGQAMPAEPLYLRPADATLPQAGGRLRR